MPLNISTNRKITNNVIVDKYISKFSFLGDKLFSNSKFGTSNKTDHFEYVRDKRLFNSLDNNQLGIGNCGKGNARIYEKNNEWFNCCNIDEKGLCFDGDSFRDLSKDKEIIEEYKKSGWVYKTLEGCSLVFEKIISNANMNTDVHAYFDTSSMLIEDALAAKTALTSWHNGVKVDNPEYTGNLYIICLEGGTEGYPDLTERWLLHAHWSKYGSAALSGSIWAPLQQIPLNYDNSSYISPDDVIILSFIDEVENTTYPTGYHGRIFPPLYAGTLSDPIQPTITYNQDLLAFQAAQPTYTSYKQVLYPIKRFGPVFDCNVLQMVAAVKGRLLTASDISSIPCSIDLTSLMTNNPYTVALEDYNVLGIFNKTSPAIEVFSGSSFGEELTVLLDLKKEVKIDTSVLLPKKIVSDNVSTYDQMWEGFRSVYQKCECQKNHLSKLYKFAIT